MLKAESLLGLLEAGTEGSHAAEAGGPGHGVLPEADLNLFNLCILGKDFILLEPYRSKHRSLRKMVGKLIPLAGL